LAAFYYSVGEVAAACDIVKHTPVGKRAARRGVSLPYCVKPTPVPVAQPPPPVVVNVEPAPVPSCAKALRQCSRK
jgi:hypothetical protein